MRSKIPIENIVLENPIINNNSYIQHNTFRFLNITHVFDQEIDWNMSDHGKLWTYNLNYFDFLLQGNMDCETGVDLMLKFAEKYEMLRDGHESYPTSLRIVNWVKFVAIHKINNDTIDSVIFTDLNRLIRNLEFHLMGNHLLENGLAVIVAGTYCQDEQAITKGCSILDEQLEEQVNDDGSHFELSPMYHQIILSRTLDCINLIRNGTDHCLNEILASLYTKASLMLGWLGNMTFRNGDIPHVNDSTFDIAPSTIQIASYAERLGVKPKIEKLTTSGYRMFRSNNAELLIDAGNIGPDYIPGHAHCDTLSFVLYINDQPFIVDPGVSTYENNSTRYYERSTQAHNTVAVDHLEQSEIWSAFRVGERARCTIHQESENMVVATHDGYRSQGIIHKRSFEFSKDCIEIDDEMNKDCKSTGLIHFHPGISATLDENQIKTEIGVLTFSNARDIKLEEYYCAKGFNSLERATMVRVEFSERMKTEISLI